MGLISDALRRAEEERRKKAQTGPITGAEAEPQPIPPEELVDIPAGLQLNPAGTMNPTVDSGMTTPDLQATSPEGAPNREGIHEAIVACHDKAAEITEQYRSLRSRLTAQNTAGENSVIVITSSIPQEGKSVTTLNLSWVMAEIKHFRILMIDGDFRRSSLASMLGISEYPGLADLLRGEARLDEVIRPTPLPNLFVMTAGTTQEFNAAELLSTQKTGNIVGECQRRFQYTFIDTPPASTVSDATVLAPWCTGVLFVVRMGKTPEPIAKSTIRMLQSSNINVLGCVLAGHRELRGRYHRYYGYYKYYGEPY